jgi:hypothetical protein
VDGGEPVKTDEGYVCPNCGQPAHPMRYAV